MTYRAVKQCPGCGWCYDPMCLWNYIDYECCPKCGQMAAPSRPGKVFEEPTSLLWPLVSARRVWTPVWFKPWTWLRREWRAKK